MWQLDNDCSEYKDAANTMIDVIIGLVVVNCVSLILILLLFFLAVLLIVVTLSVWRYHCHIQQQQHVQNT